MVMKLLATPAPGCWRRLWVLTSGVKDSRTGDTQSRMLMVAQLSVIMVSRLRELNLLKTLRMWIRNFYFMC